ncbi:MAG: hypothetical protein KDA87_17340, partial [Planctomycetales bacterium]|nr:hypothetical protein [Planctomycetales bacterium]
FRLLLSHYGTCNAITTFESAMYGQARETKVPAVELLVSHVYDELRSSVVAHLQRLNITCDAAASLRQLVSDHPQLFDDGAYHIDTTHLASTVRAAKDLSDSQRIHLADELAAYGRRLAPELQYPGDPPFAEFYPAHQKYFAILLNPNSAAVADELDYFRQQAVDSNPMEETTAAIEVYIDLLHRIGRSQAAIDARRELLPDDIQTTGQAPGLLELCQAANNFDPLKQLCLQRQDLLGYTMAVLQATSERK